MTVRSKVGRFRYVAFDVASTRPVSTEALVHALRQASRVAGLDATRLVTFRDGVGILRCGHTSRDRAVAMLSAVREVDGLPVLVTPIGTSGTIRKAHARFIVSRRESP